jgi:excisionase family DNA binding protein
MAETDKFERLIRDLDGDQFTTLEVARMLGMAVRSVQLMVDRGDLEAWKTPGGHRRISRASLEKWLRSRMVDPNVESTMPSHMLRRRRTDQINAERAPLKVLLIEDSMHYQNLVSLLIKQRFPDVELRVAGDGVTGLVQFGQFQPDVLLIDLLLPGVDGATLITALRADASLAPAHLIVLTSLDEAQRVPYAFALTDLPVIYKPRLVIELPNLLADRLGEGARSMG